MQFVRPLWACLAISCLLISAAPAQSADHARPAPLRTAWLAEFEAFAAWYAHGRQWDRENNPAVELRPFPTGRLLVDNMHAYGWNLAACGGVPRPCDLGRAEGSFFTYVAAFGLFTDVSYATPQAAKNLLGHFAYVLQGAGKLFNVPSFHIKVESAEGFVTEGDYIYGMVSNTVSVGGLMNLPRDVVKLDDGRFEVLLVREPKNLLDWQEILTALTSQKLIGSEGIVTGFQTEKVTFTCDKPVAWTVDGEFGGERAVTRVENLPRAFVLAYGE